MEKKDYRMNKKELLQHAREQESNMYKYQNWVKLYEGVLLGLILFLLISLIP